MKPPASATFLPGKYYIGDPCYAIQNWEEYLSKIPLDEQGEWDDGVPFEYHGHQVWHDHTKYGDGGYFDQYHREYGVDAGIIGVIPVALIPKHKIGKINGGQFIDFDKSFDVAVKDGIFYIGEIIIDTAQEDEEEDEE